eukprot:g9361.t1
MSASSPPPRLWLRNEVFDGVLPLRATGVPLSPARHAATGGAAGPSPLFVLLKAVREVNPETVRYTTWITEGWRVLQWSEPSAKLFWEMLCMYQCHSPRLGSTEKASGGVTKEGKVQAIELSVSQLALFLFLHLHPDSTNHRSASQRTHQADSVWPSEEAAAALGGSPRRTGRVGHGRSTSPNSLAGAPSSPRGFGTGASAPGIHVFPSSSPLSPTRARSMRLHTRTSDDAHRLGFVKRHLHELLRLASSHPAALLATPSALSSMASGSSKTLQQQAKAVTEAGAAALSGEIKPESGGAAESVEENVPDLSRDEFESMGFLLTGGVSLEEERAPGVSLADLCPLWNQGGRPRERVPISEVADYLMGALTVNEVLYPVPPSPAAIFLADSAAPPGGHLSDEAVTPGGGGGATTAAAGSGCGGGGGEQAGHAGGGVIVPALPSAPLLVNCASRTTVVHNADASGPLRDLQVNCCQESYVYVLSAVRFATVMGCKDCTVVIGAAAGMVRVEECERMQLVTCCRRLTVTNSLECIFPIFVATPPVLSGDNRACQFAPYNSCYPRHKAHLQRAGLLGEGDEEIPANLWENPVEASMMGMPSMSAGTPTSGSRAKSRSPGGKGGPGGGMGHELSPAIMPPEQFYTLAVPVPPDSPDEPPAENPFGLPSEYAAVLQEREAAVESLHQAIQDAGLTPRQNRELEECIRGRFTEWLVATGNLRQVLDLVGVAEKAASKGNNGGSGGTVPAAVTAAPATGAEPVTTPTKTSPQQPR